MRDGLTIELVSFLRSSYKLHMHQHGHGHMTRKARGNNYSKNKDDNPREPYGNVITTPLIES